MKKGCVLLVIVLSLILMMYINKPLSKQYWTNLGWRLVSEDVTIVSCAVVCHHWVRPLLRASPVFLLEDQDLAWGIKVSLRGCTPPRTSPMCRVEAACWVSLRCLTRGAVSGGHPLGAR